MHKGSGKRIVYRIPPSKYWAHYWYPWPIGILATVQMILSFLIISMEIGNAVVDIFRANVYSGFWSYPFMIAAILSTYACVFATRTQTKATVALILQVLSIFVMMIVIGFLIAFIATGFTLCLGIQCSQSSSTSFSSSDYSALKKAFISTEFVCSIGYVVCSIIYIVLFVKCYKKLPRIHPLVRREPSRISIEKRKFSTVSTKSRPLSVSVVSSNNQLINSEHIRLTSSTTVATGTTGTTAATGAAGTVPATNTSIAYTGVEKMCPNCRHISPYIPSGYIVECPNCKYQSPLVEHAQQW